MTTMKSCHACKQEFPATAEFFKTSVSKQSSPNPLGLHSYCRTCTNKKTLEWAHKNKEQQRAAVQRWYTRNYETLRVRYRAQAAALRVQVLTHYSNGLLRCACCAEALIEFLTIDHVNGGGTAHRKAMKGRSIFQHLVKAGFPPGYRVLCWNCNSSLGIRGYCPHQSVHPN